MYYQLAVREKAAEQLVLAFSSRFDSTRALIAGIGSIDSILCLKTKMTW
jgi:hypothetical protein